MVNRQHVGRLVRAEVAERLLDVVDELDLVIRETVLLPPSEPDRPAA
jgi:hypothetical protein